MIHILDHGIPDGWYLQDKYNSIMYEIIKQIDIAFPDDTNLILSTSWDQMAEPGRWSGKYLARYTNIFCISTFDWFPIERYHEFKNQCDNLYCLGNSTGDRYFSFWSIVVDEFYSGYSLDEITPTSFKYNYLCYNRKPHNHRLELVEQILVNNLHHCGIVTLGNGEISDYYPYCRATVPMAVPDEYAQGSTQIHLGNTHVVGINAIPNDIFSLGNLDIWKSSFLNVVTETTTYTDIFLSEKIFKPMLGMRPFVVLGDTGLLRFLKKNGFRTFDRWFDESYDNETCPVEKVKKLLPIIKRVSALTQEQMHSMYNEMRPILEHNRKHLKVFADKNRDTYKYNLFKKD